MANIDQTEFPIKLAGKSWKLTYPYPAIWAYEDAAGISIYETEAVENDTPEAATARFNDRVFGFGRPFRVMQERLALMLWAGLKTCHPDITVEKAAAMIYPKNLFAVQKAVSLAFTNSLSNRDDGGEEETDPLEKSAANL